MSGEHIDPGLLARLRELSVGPSLQDSGMVLINQHALHALVRALEQRPATPAEIGKAAEKLNRRLLRLQDVMTKKTDAIMGASRAAAELALAVNGNTSR